MEMYIDFGLWRQDFEGDTTPRNTVDPPVYMAYLPETTKE
jgi:hypothetical protein